MPCYKSLYSGGVMAKITFEVLKHFGTISTNDKSKWSKELNLVSWNSRDPKLDVRDWAPGHGKMSKGITLTTEEASKLGDLLASCL